MGIDKKQELLRTKLKTYGKKGNKTTPSPSWKLGFDNSASLGPNLSMNTCVSARKIGANLWEVQPQYNYTENDRDGDGFRRRRHQSYEKEGIEVSDELDEDGDPQPPEINTSLRRNIKEAPNLSLRKNGEDQQHISSASCCSSMQVTPYAFAVAPTGYTLKTSTHLLKVLNRIWNLEEQNSLNVASIKALKRELDISQAQIKTLLKERKTDRQEIDELKKSTHDWKKKTVQSTKDEISDIKSSLTREKKARILLESLCDEFAKGIRDYEQKARFLQKRLVKKDGMVMKNEPDRLILHVSEAWLDERAQMKSDSSEKTSISDNLCCEIETFLEAKKKQCGNSNIVVEASSSQLVSRIIDQGHGVAEPCVHEGVKSNTLMAKLLEARLETQFSKSRTITR